MKFCKAAPIVLDEPESALSVAAVLESVAPELAEVAVVAVAASELVVAELGSTPIAAKALKIAPTRPPPSHVAVDVPVSAVLLTDEFVLCCESRDERSVRID
jgi:hypothetical protein